MDPHTTTWTSAVGTHTVITPRGPGSEEEHEREVAALQALFPPI